MSRITAVAVILVAAMIAVAACSEPEPPVSPLPTVSPLSDEVGADAPAETSPVPSIEEIWEAIADFFTDARLHTIGGLIFVDLALGVAAAIHTGEFELQRVADFYRTNVAPYVVGYLALYTAFAVMPGLGDIIDQALRTACWGAIVAALVGSIRGNVAELALEPLQDDYSIPCGSA